MTHFSNEHFDEALRGRMQKAFASVHAPAGLKARIEERLSAKAPSAAPARSRIFRLRWPAAIAASILVAVGLLGVYLATTPAEATAAQMELVSIHEHNLSDKAGLFQAAQPEELHEYLQKRVKDAPPIPQPAPGTKFQGCCVANFEGKPAASYLIQTPEGPVTIIVLPQKPQAMGMKLWGEKDGLTYWSAKPAQCTMAGVECSPKCGHTFYAVGQVPVETLVKALSPARRACCPV